MSAPPSGRHLCVDDGSPGIVPLFEPAQEAYDDSGAVPYNPRTVEAITSFFDGLEPVGPGVVPDTRWRPSPVRPPRRTSPRTGTSPANRDHRTGSGAPSRAGARRTRGSAWARDARCPDEPKALEGVTRAGSDELPHAALARLGLPREHTAAARGHRGALDACGRSRIPADRRGGTASLRPAPLHHRLPRGRWAETGHRTACVRSAPPVLRIICWRTFTVVT